MSRDRGEIIRKAAEKFIFNDLHSSFDVWYYDDIEYHVIKNRGFKEGDAGAYLHYNVSTSSSNELYNKQ